MLQSGWALNRLDALTKPAIIHFRNASSPENIMCFMKVFARNHNLVESGSTKPVIIQFDNVFLAEIMCFTIIFSRNPHSSREWGPPENSVLGVLRSCAGCILDP